MTPSDFPAVLDCATNRQYKLGAATRFVVGRSEDAHLSVTNLRCSRKHFQIVRDGGKYFVESLVKENPTYLDGREVAGRAPLGHGATLRAGENDFRFLLKPDAAPARAARPVPAALATGPADDGLRTVTASARQVTEVLALQGNFRLAGTMTLGRDSAADIALDHPQVSRRHAVLVVRADGRAELRDNGSANGTFVNGRRLTGRPVLLTRDDRINIGPYALVFTGPELVSQARGDNVELIAEGVGRVVKNRQTGEKLTLLDGVTLVFRPREFVCLLGPSGCGKSTLMTILSGRAYPDGGTVTVNGQDLHANFDALKKDLALVPQKDVLHDSLTVGQALRYTARLRLPPDTTPAEAEARIADTLNTVTLTERSGTVIRKLSGGQIKRACLANEILCKPNLLFLDEVTSGLDERTDSDMMDLFRDIAHGGKTVVCITHSLANVERTSDLVVILTPGGKLAFVGSPAEARAYFGIDRLGLVYNLIESDNKDGRVRDPLPEVWQQRYEASPHYTRRGPADPPPAFPPPDFWRDAFQASPEYAKYVVDRLPRGRARGREPGPQPRRMRARAGLLLRQGAVLTRRYLAIWRGDATALAAMAGQSLVVALLLMIVFGSVPDLAAADRPPRTVNLLFLMAISSFWFGCNTAAKEVVKERTIYTRECDFNLLAGSYYASKLVVLCLFSFVQTAILFGLTKAYCDPPGNAAGQLAVLLALAAAGTTLGLLISTLAASEEMAITLIPMVIIPQIILSGTIAPLAGVGKTLAAAGVTTYWGKRGLDALLPDDIGKIARAAKLAEDGSFAVPLAVLAAHAAVFVVATLTIMSLRGRAAGLKIHRLKQVVAGR